MYIPEFWCGFISCLILEFSIVLIFGIIIAVKSNNKNDKEDKQ